MRAWPVPRSRLPTKSGQDHSRIIGVALQGKLARLAEVLVLIILDDKIQRLDMEIDGRATPWLDEAIMPAIVTQYRRRRV
jgi:hypothetical protein